MPPGTNLDVRRQAGVDQALGVGDRPFVELGDAGRERFYEHVEIGVGQGAINVAVGLGLLSPEVFRAQEHFEGAVSADEAGQPGHGAAAGDHPYTHLPLRDDGFFAAGETHVAGQRDLAAVVVARPRMRAMEATGNRVRRTRKSGRGGKPVGPSGNEVLKLGRQIGVIQEVVVDRAVELRVRRSILRPCS